MEKQSLHPKEFCLVHFKSKALSTALRRVDDILWSKSLEEIEQIVRPTPIERRLKVRYWQLVSGNLKSEPFRLRRLHEGICCYTQLYCNILTKPAILAWILKPSSIFEDQLELLQVIVLNKIHDFVVNIEVHKQDGTVNPRAASGLVKVVGILFGLNEKYPR